MSKFMDEMMAEMICYGGQAATRAEAYEHALSCMADAPTKMDADRAAQMFAFGPRAITLTPEQAARLPRFKPI